MRHALVLGVLALSWGAPQANEGLRRALGDELAGPWVYDDLEAGYAEARASGKPLLVSIRCVP
jgi:hypothetical protein